LYEERFNGDGAVVSYLNKVGGTKETTMKLAALASAFARRSGSHHVASGDGRKFMACRYRLTGMAAFVMKRRMSWTAGG
jgi:hypothetical protein